MTSVLCVKLQWRIATGSFTCFSYFPISSPVPAALFMVQRSKGSTPSVCISTDSSPLTAGIGKLMLGSNLFLQWCLASTSLAWPNTTAPQLHPLHLLLPNCVPFSYHSLIASPSAATPNCIPFSCCSPIASPWAAAPRLHPLELLLPDCVRFTCCFPIVSASAASPQLHLPVIISCAVQSIIITKLRITSVIGHRIQGAGGESAPHFSVEYH